MTGQSLLDTMELLDQELQLQPGEANVTRGLLALNIAQDIFEAALAKRPNCLGSSDGTFTQTASQEYSLWPSNLLRLDGLQYIDPTTSRPAWDLSDYRRVGSHAAGYSWFSQLVSGSTSTGKPTGFWTNGTKIFWDPLPDTTNTIRWYGLAPASDITAGGTFAYPDVVRLPLATLAVSIYKMGVDDDPSDVASLSSNLFDSTIDLLSNVDRVGARPLIYTENHR